MNFVGIDLSWGVTSPKPNRTAAGVLTENCELVANALLTTDDDILEFIKNYLDEGCIVGIDAPLVIPPNVKQRECERQLLLCKIAVFPGNRAWFVRAFGGVRGEILVDRLKECNLQLRDFIEPKKRTSAVLEVYPYASWRVLFEGDTVPKYKNTTRKRKIQGLTQLRKKLFEIDSPRKLRIPKNLDHKLDVDLNSLDSGSLDQLGDLLDATIAAYTVLMYWHFGDEKCVVLGDLRRGFILTLASDCLRKTAFKRKY
ncbi:MAG: DUF429 domain-containing protein [Thermoplasmata archaeon]|nr:MAG: DUF429 domain-containing protein [Thermoplasmata archaeon]